MSDLKKRGLLKFTNGKYTNQDGVEKSRYVTAGEYYSTDGGNRQAIKLYATAFSEERWLNIYLEDDAAKPTFEPKPTVDKIADVDLDAPISLDNIPF